MEYLTTDITQNSLNILLKCFDFMHKNMADYKCFEWEKEFTNEKSIISHLKIKHFCKDNTEPIQCVINYEHRSACCHTVLTFNGLRKHIKTCLKKRNDFLSNNVTSTGEQTDANNIPIDNNLLESFEEKLLVDTEVHILVQFGWFVFHKRCHKYANKFKAKINLFSFQWFRQLIPIQSRETNNITTNYTVM